MPILTDDMEQHQMTGSGFAFSARKIDEKLGAGMFTIGFIGVDCSGSLEGREQDLEAMLKMAVESCRKSPRANNMMLLVYLFAKRSDFGGEFYKEVHGMIPLQDTHDDLYDGCIGSCRGATPLYDAAMYGLGAVEDYGRKLDDGDFMVNGIGFLLTDGENYPPNASAHGPDSVKKKIAELTQSESLESFRPILIGFNTSATAGLSASLRAFKDDAGFDQYVDVKDATTKSLAKIADFVDRSYSSQSQSVGSGGPSNPMKF